MLQENDLFQLIFYSIFFILFLGFILTEAFI